MHAVTTYSENTVNALRSELEQAHVTIAELRAERDAADSWAALSEAKAAAHKAQQEAVNLAAELERERQEKAPGRRELVQLQSDLEYANERVRILEAELAAAQSEE
jgi:chromosome segregation ATPase